MGKKITENEGFSLIGVVVTSAIGLIIILGLAIAFKQMNQQLESLKNENRKEVLFMRINVLLSKRREICNETFENYKHKILSKEDFTLSKIPDSDIDFDDEAFLKKYNLKPKQIDKKTVNYMQMKCVNCSNPFRQTWSLIVHTQDKNDLISSNEVMDIRLNSYDGKCIMN